MKRFEVKKIDGLRCADRIYGVFDNLYSEFMTVNGKLFHEDNAMAKTMEQRMNLLQEQADSGNYAK